MAEPTSILIRNATAVVTMNDAGEVLSDASIFIRGNRIEAVMQDKEVERANRVIDGRDKVVFPGFINTHHHLYQVLTRNLPAARDLPLFDWLTLLYPLWGRLTPDALYHAARAGMAELLLTGCTTTVDHHYVFPGEDSLSLVEAEVEAARQIGIRLHLMRGSMSRGRSKGGLPPDELVEDRDRILRDSQRAIEKFHDPDSFSRCQVGLAPCSPFSVDSDLMKEVLALARSSGVSCHTHIAETQDELRYCKEVYGTTPLRLLESLGWLGEDISLAHCVHLDDAEIELLASTRTGVSLCTTSNLRLRSGMAPVGKMFNAGVKLSLGVDGSASNDSSDFVGELRQAFLIYRLPEEGSSMAAKDFLRMATRGGAEVLGRRTLGRIEPGAAADLCLFDVSGVDFAGTQEDPSCCLVYAGICHRAHTVLVDGRIVVEEGRLKTAEESEIAREASLAARRLVSR